MNKIKTLDNLRDFIWNKCGMISMETVDEILDVVKRNQRLLAQHKYDHERSR